MRPINPVSRTVSAILLIIGALFLSATSIADSLQDLQIDHSIIPADIANAAVLLRERALLDNLSVDIVESLTTEVGARRIGTQGDKRGVAWAQAKFD